MGGPTAARRPAAPRSLPRTPSGASTRTCSAPNPSGSTACCVAPRASPSGRPSSRPQRRRSPSRCARNTSRTSRRLTHDALDAPVPYVNSAGLVVRDARRGHPAAGLPARTVSPRQDQPHAATVARRARRRPTTSPSRAASPRRRRRHEQRDDAARPAAALRRPAHPVRRSALDADGAAEPLLRRPHARHSRATSSAGTP